MKNFDINSFMLGKHYSIEASAGTGKTYNIVNIVEKLIKNGVDLKKILIVTYTEKAAEELKNRIREKVANVDIDSASIGTIHSFCQNAISEFSISAGKPANLALIDESEAQDFASRYIREPANIGEVAAIKSKGLLAFNSDQAAKTLTELTKFYYLDKDCKEVPSIVSYKPLMIKENAVKTAYRNILFGRDIRDGNTDLLSMIDVCKKSSVPELKKVYEAIKDTPYLFYNGKIMGKNVRTSLSPDEKKAIGVIDTIRIMAEKMENDSSILEKIFIDYHIADFYEQWQIEKAKRTVETYNDMIRTVREEVVKGKPLLDCLQKKYQYAIIDEFQDTNQKQWDIFKKVFFSDGHNIIVVGDPKQSIYSFQGADLTVYNKARDEIINAGGEALSLTCNYRACESIITSTNTFFKGKNALPDSISFQQSTTGKKNLAFRYYGEKEPSYWIYERDEDLKGKAGYKELYAKVICQTIVDCCSFDGGKTHLTLIDEDKNERNVSFGDFAILVKVRSELPSIIKALEESGIPYVNYKDQTLFEGIECAHWIALLEAVASPDFSGKNRAKFRKALYTRFFEASFEEISSTEYEKDNIPEILLFDKWRELAKNGRWGDLFSAILFDTDLASRMQSLKDLKSFGIFRQIGDYCAEYLGKVRNLDALIRHLKRMQKAKGDDDADDGTAAISTDFDSVKIMTIHAAKGLEFPVVISFAGFNQYRNSSGIYGYHENGQYIISLTKPKELYDKEQEEEWKRLFYVAYTRAKYVLMLPCFQMGKKFIGNSVKDYVTKGNPYRKLSDNGSALPNLKAEVTKILGTGSVSTGSGSTMTDQENVLKKLVRDKSAHSSYKHAYSSLSHKIKKEEQINEQGIVQDQSEDWAEFGLAKYDAQGKQIPCDYESSIAPVALKPDFPAGANLGNTLHELFEQIDYEKKPDTAETRELILSCFEKNGFQNAGRFTDDVVTIIENVLNAKFPEIHGAKSGSRTFQLSEIGFVDRKNEVEFNFNMADERLKNFFNGFIDLIIRRGDAYSILDWKSDRLNDDFTSYSDGTMLKNHIDSLYSIQRVLYSYCLIKWLKSFYKDLSEQEIFERHFGGVYYVCLRGCAAGTGNGIYAQTWDSFDSLESAYQKIISERIGG